MLDINKWFQGENGMLKVAIEQSSGKQLADYNFYFTPIKRGTFYGYAIELIVIKKKDGEQRKSIAIKNANHSSFWFGSERYFDFSEAQVKCSFYAEKIKEKIAIHFAEEQKNLQDQAARDALAAAKPDPAQTSELTKTDPTKIDPAKYQKELADLQKKNAATISSLQVSPEENAAALARLAKIQAELVKRKQVMQELAQSKITAQLIDQQKALAALNQQLEVKAQAVKTAQATGDIALAKQLNAEYNELRRKQAASLAFIENLQQNATFNTFVKFTSLEQLYNPDYVWAEGEQVTVMTYQATSWEQAQPYVLWGAGITGVVLVGYLAWKGIGGRVLLASKG